MMYPLVQHQRSTTPQNQQNQSTPLQSLSQLLQNQSQTNFQGNNSNQGQQQQQPLQLQNLAQRHAQQIYQNKNIQARQNQNQNQNQNQQGNQQRRGQQQSQQQQEQDADVEQQNEARERHRHRRPLYRRFFNYVREAWTGVKFALDSELEDLETPPRYRPDSLGALCKATRFSEAEIKRIYRGFKAECPTGVVREDTFKMIYAQFFPQGANTSQYAHYVFNTLDQDHSGLISFEDFVHGLSILSRGSLDEKLRWTFSLYDINGDGYITREEMTDIVSAIYDLMGKIAEPCVDDDTVKDKVDRIFKKMDVNNDGVVTLDEFLECCRKDEDISSSMNVFDSAI